MTTRTRKPAVPTVTVETLPEFLRSPSLAEFIAAGLDKLATDARDDLSLNGGDAIAGLYAHAAAEIREFDPSKATVTPGTGAL